MTSFWRFSQASDAPTPSLGWKSRSHLGPGLQQLIQSDALSMISPISLQFQTLIITQIWAFNCIWSKVLCQMAADSPSESLQIEGIEIPKRSSTTLWWYVHWIWYCEGLGATRRWLALLHWYFMRRKITLISFTIKGGHLAGPTKKAPKFFATDGI